MGERVLFYYFVAINFVTFFIYGIDKLKSMKKGARRISERELHTFSLIGGFLGASAAMALFGHKISKREFLLTHAAILLLWIISIVLYFTEINPFNFLR